MIRLQMSPPTSLADARALLQTAIGVEFGTLPPYLYALFSIMPDTNAVAVQRIKSVALQEMIHMCLACNILNAIGGDPIIQVQDYPGPLPGDIGPPDGDPLQIHLYPFSPDAMTQAMNIEQPESPPDFPIKSMLAATAAPATVTIGQFYDALDAFLATLPNETWQPNRNQITDDQYFAGQLFAIHNYADAHRAITEIVSEGEGAKDDPLDFQHEIAHYYRFGELLYDRVLTKDDNAMHYAWGPQRLGVDWSAVRPAIADPGAYDFRHEPQAVRDAQYACNLAFTNMVLALQRAVRGTPGALGDSVHAMFDLRLAAQHAMTVPLADRTKVAGPAFIVYPLNEDRQA